MQIFNFGSINIDHVYRMPHLVRPGETLACHSLTTVLGGKGANQSVALARAGVAVRHVGRLSRDDRWALDEMTAAGVDVSGVESVDGVSGHAIIQVDDAGENCIVLHGGANRGFDRAFLRAALGDAACGDWLVLQNECDALDEAIAIALDQDMQVAFNPAPMNESVRDLPIERLAILSVNETEARALAGVGDELSAIAMLGERYPDTRVVLTRGAEGVRQHFRGECIDVPAPSVTVVDTTGAGDTFAGYHVAGIARGLADRDALELATRAAALAVTRQGASPSIPSVAEVRQHFS